ncbi:MAG: sigma 54-interacting transcriptional regulator [Pseudomonadota bacterium]
MEAADPCGIAPSSHTSTDLSPPTRRGILEVRQRRRPVGLRERRGQTRTPVHAGHAREAGAGRSPKRVFGLVGGSPAIREVHRLVRCYARHALPTLVLGETGTGKELVARAFHDAGPRKGGSFITVSCTNLPETMVEDELFGHRKGAFTGATEQRAGAFEAADGGTLFLDEIGDMPLSAQVKILPAVQEGKVRRLGENDERPGNVRELERVVYQALVTGTGSSLRAGALRRVIGLAPALTLVGPGKDATTALIAALEGRSSVSSADLRALLGVSRTTLGRLAQPLLAAGRVVREGGGAQTRYSLAPAAESSDADPRWATIRAMTAREGRMTRKRAAELLGLCERSATRILTAMVEAGELVDCGGQGRAAGYLLPAETAASAVGGIATSRVPRACQGTGRPSLLLVDTGTAGVDSPGRHP